MGPGVQTAARPRFPPPPGPSAGPPSLEVSPYTVARGPGLPTRPRSGNLGGWYRALDLAGGPVQLHDGLLSRDGWYLLDDTPHGAAPGRGRRASRRGPRATAPTRTATSSATATTTRAACADLRRLTGRGAAAAAPGVRGLVLALLRLPPVRLPAAARALPRRARAARRADGRHRLQGAARAGTAGTGSRACSPTRAASSRWAHGEGLAVSLNTHPSITVGRPAPRARRSGVAGRRAAGRPDRRALPHLRDGRRRATAAARPAADRGLQGVRLGARGRPGRLLRAARAVRARGRRLLVARLLLRRVLRARARADPGRVDQPASTPRRNAARGSRWPVLSRVGASVFDPDAGRRRHLGRAPQRHPLHRRRAADLDDARLPDRCSRASEGNVGHPLRVARHRRLRLGHRATAPPGRHLADDLYVRWVQSGTFQPILRLHSDHGDRLPWDYGGKAREVSAEFLRLRGALMPYLYTLAREAHDRGAAHSCGRCTCAGPSTTTPTRTDHQYMLGPQLLVAPVGIAGRPGHEGGVVPAGPLGRLLHRRGATAARGQAAQRAARAHARVRPRGRDRAAAGLPAQGDRRAAASA